MEAQKILRVSPALPTSADLITVYLADATCLSVLIVFQDNIIYLNASPGNCPPLAPPDPGLVSFAVIGSLAPGSYTLVLQVMGRTTDSRVIFVNEPTTALSLFKGRFAVTVTRTDPEAGAAAQAVQASDASGYFWFSDKGAIEITVKMINGAALTGHYWIFIGSLTDRAFTVTVKDTWLCSNSVCPSRTYESPAGVNKNFFDLNAFPSP